MAVVPETVEFVWLKPKFVEAVWPVGELGEVDPPEPGDEAVDVGVATVDDAPRFDVEVVVVVPETVEFVWLKPKFVEAVWPVGELGEVDPPEPRAGAVDVGVATVDDAPRFEVEAVGFVVVVAVPLDPPEPRAGAVDVGVATVDDAPRFDVEVVVVVPETVEFVWLKPKFVEAVWPVGELGEVDPPEPRAGAVDVGVVNVGDAPRFDVEAVVFVAVLEDG